MLWRKKAEPVSERVLRCSFCNKDKHDVAKLIAGPGVFICGGCVAVCNDILADDARVEQSARHRAAASRDESPKPWPNAIECALCRTQLERNDSVAVGGNRGILCADCVSAVQVAAAGRHNVPAPPL
jgi:hypothetical protein